VLQGAYMTADPIAPNPTQPEPASPEAEVVPEASTRCSRSPAGRGARPTGRPMSDGYGVSKMTRAALQDGDRRNLACFFAIVAPELQHQRF
jgi:hypothetical protein